MTATAARTVHRTVPARFRPVAVPPAPGLARGLDRRCGAARPAPVSARERRARALRRRIVLGAAGAALLVALALPWGGAGGHTLAAPGSVLAGAAANHPFTYVVQPGDTMWSIAQRLDPTGDPRAVVAELQAQVGSDTLQPGERLTLP